MGPRRRLPLLALLAPGLACAPGTSPATPAPMVIEEAVDQSLLNLVTAVLVADARMEPASPLYAEGATTVADGEVRHFPPRYAGLAPGGEVGITTSRVEVRPGVAWAFVEYRWISTAEGTAREGVATFVLVPATGGGVGWRVRHAHSSSPGREGQLDLPVTTSRRRLAVEGLSTFRIR